MRTPRIFLVLALAALPFAWSACTHEGPEPMDMELLRRAMALGPRQWYGNTPELRPRSEGSGHPEAFLRTRYDPIAMHDVDSAGHVLPGAVFDDGALIVKELYDSPGHLYRYAIMYKKPGNGNADSDGWIWCEARPGGEVTTPASEQGSACRSCHGQGGNIDHTLMNVAFP
jgi:hypothetical protein